MSDNDGSNEGGDSELTEALGAILTKYDLNIPQLAEFIGKHSEELELVRTRRLQNKAYFVYRKEIGRQVLRRSFEGETYREIARQIDVKEANCYKIKKSHIDRIFRLIFESKAKPEELASEYGLRSGDIQLIFDNEQQKREQRDAKYRAIAELNWED